MNTAIRLALANAKVCPSARLESVTVQACINALDKGVGTIKEGRGWTANVSTRTLKALQSSGVFS
jgi:hypothetical protein